MLRLPPRATRTDPLFPYPTRVRSGENQHVGAGRSGGKRRPVKRAGKANLGISPHQPVARRAITDHDLRSGMTASEERLDILLDRNASDIELDRPRHRLEGSARRGFGVETRSEEHTSELQSLMRTSYAVLCLKKNT